MSTGLRVHHLNCACIQRLRLRGRRLVCHCLLVETPASGLVLVDTGLGTLDYANLTSRLSYSFVYGYANPKRDPSFAAINQIRALGYDPADVRHIVMTHMDLDHVGGLADFPTEIVHLHAAEMKQCTERRTFKDRHRYLPAMWAHGIRAETYSEEGEPWFGFEAVRELRGLPPELLFIPLFGHTMGHCGVALQTETGWMLHAGDAYFDDREIKRHVRECGWMVGAFQAIVQTDRGLRLHNQQRLRTFAAQHPEVRIFAAHNPYELEVMTGKIAPPSTPNNSFKPTPLRGAA